jgi:RNA-directed DNA polymerase
VFPSKAALVQEREKIRTITAVIQSHTPLPYLIKSLNRQVTGWANYFSYGYARQAWWEIDWFLRGRLIQHFNGAVNGRIVRRPA